MNKETGFTLMELIVTMAVAAIVLVLGVPSFLETISNNRLTSNANALVAALNLARAEAVKRNARVTLCKSADGRCCTNSGGYDQGWIVFADPDGNAVRRDSATCGPEDPNDPEPIVQVGQALSGGLTLTGDTNVANYVSYVSSGVSRLSNNGGFQAGSLTLCKSGYATSARQIVLSSGGRVRVDKKVPASSVCP